MPHMTMSRKKHIFSHSCHYARVSCVGLSCMRQSFLNYRIYILTLLVLLCEWLPSVSDPPTAARGAVLLDLIVLILLLARAFAHFRIRIRIWGRSKVSRFLASKGL